MTPRHVAVISEIEEQRAMLATRAAKHAGEAAELRAALEASQAEAAAQKMRADDLQARLDAMQAVEPEPSAGDHHA